tara:strand:- start:1919 stop:2884 length:966 start_codon:yes stop_codon:yes gene_type:complete
MSMTKTTIITILSSVWLICLGQESFGIDLKQPSALILGTEYVIQIPISSKDTSYLVVLDNDTLTSKNGTISFRPQNGPSKLYCIELLSLTEGRHEVLEHNCYERIRMPDPTPAFTGFDGSTLIWLSRDSIDNLDRVELLFSNTGTDQVLEVRDIEAAVEVSEMDTIFRFKGGKVSKEFKSFISSKNGTWDIKLHVSFIGSDNFKRIVTNNFKITIQTKEEYLRHLNPCYDLHKNKHVEFIGPGSFEKDTLRMKNPIDLYIQLRKLGTENNYTFESIDSDEKFKVHVINECEGFLDMRNKHGTYRVSLWGDGGAGSLILVIE